jgi:hypothetical protein
MLIAKIGLGVLITSAYALPREPVGEITIPAGTRLVGTLIQTISTETTPVGARATLRTEELTMADNARLPAGILVRGVVTEASQGGRVRSRAKITLRFERLTVEGRDYDIVTEPWTVKGKSESKSSLRRVIGGAVAGGVVGAIVGETKEGIALGTMVGTGAAVATKGGNITLPAGQSVEVQLTEPVTVSIRSVNLIPQGR